MSPTSNSATVDPDAPTTTIGENPLDVEPLDEAPTELLITDIETGAGREATPGDTVGWTTSA